MKDKRTENRNLLDYYQGKPCLICRSERTTVGHHIKTKGSGGPDEKWNLVPLCHAHHDSIHRLGTARFANLNYVFVKFLISYRWRFIQTDYGGKWLPPCD